MNKRGLTNIPLRYKKLKDIEKLTKVLSDFGYTIEDSLLDITKLDKKPLALTIDTEKRKLSITQSVTIMACWCNGGLSPLYINEFLDNFHRLMINKDEELYNKLIINKKTIVEEGILKDIKLSKYIKIPKNVTIIAGYIFNKEDIKLYDSYFYNCLNENDVLEEVEMDDSVEVIGEKAFENAKYLSKIKLSKNLKSIKILAFNNCHRLKEITLPKSIESIDEFAFFNIKNLKVIYEGSKEEWNLIKIDKNAFEKDVNIIFKNK